MIGIDVSYWQGAIVWPVVAGTQDFAIVRSGDGGFADPRRIINGQQARAAGLTVDVYHFLRWNIPVADMVDLIRDGYEAADPDGIGRLWLDAEDTDPGSKPLGWLTAVVAGVEALGIRVGIYTGAWWWNPLYSAAAVRAKGLDRLPLWFAHYPRSNSVHDPDDLGDIDPIIPNGWNDWKIWQYSSTGSVPGISGNVDLNLAKADAFDRPQEGDDMSQYAEEAVQHYLALEVGDLVSVKEGGRSDPAVYQIAELSIGGFSRKVARWVTHPAALQRVQKDGQEVIDIKALTLAMLRDDGEWIGK